MTGISDRWTDIAESTHHMVTVNSGEGIYLIKKLKNPQEPHNGGRVKNELRLSIQCQPVLNQFDAQAQR